MSIRKSLAALAMLASIAVSTSSAYATSLIYAIDGKGGMGFSIGNGARGERLAIAGCGGFAKGCKVVMRADGDCMAFTDLKGSDGQYYYWVGYTIAQNAYARQSEIQRVEDMVTKWCEDAQHGSISSAR